MTSLKHTQYPIAFIDAEIDPNNKQVVDIGCVKHNGNQFHRPSLSDLEAFVKDVPFVCGHNVFRHDLVYIGTALKQAGVQYVIDTLYYSPLLFPSKPYHALVKDDKLQSDELNNPLNDAIKAMNLFYDEVAAFGQLDEELKQIYYLLLHDKREFRAFFKYVGYSISDSNVSDIIRSYFRNEICDYTEIDKIVKKSPVELAYCLGLIHAFVVHHKVHSVTPMWVLKNYPDTDRIMSLLRNKPCLLGCTYCDRALNPIAGLKRFFGYDAYRRFDGEPLQENAVRAALEEKSILTIFPTGGGKSITFQVPALMAGENVNALTIVISPLQSLMKDQVDNLERAGITDAVTINGLLDPIERARSFERVEDGSARLLYISPESLRSRSIEKLILGRKIARFVIDEAHCFSSWGQDFRVDYLYIGDFIKSIQEMKNLEDCIPVSCFTATAKLKVIEDIRTYFKDKLNLDLQLFTSKVARTNLHYKVFQKENEDDKYLAVRNLLEAKNCPTIIYTSRTHKASRLADRLTSDGFTAKPYHGKMDTKEKSANQNAFIAGEVSIMVATSAFGMGVDKKDVGMVIHYDISDSLENYVQEAGRAGRDQRIEADCYVMFNEEDLSKHFILLNQTKLSIKEIQQVWKAIKDLTRLRTKVSNSALEIARKAGWDENVQEIETRVTTAVAALEDAGYLKRGQNMPRVYANSIMVNNLTDAITKINDSVRFNAQQKNQAIRIIKSLFSSKRKLQQNDEVVESRIDYMSDFMGIVLSDVINIINLLKEERILGDTMDLKVFIKKSDQINRSLNIVENFIKIESFLISYLEEEEEVIQLKEINEEAEKAGIPNVNLNKIKTILNFLAIKNWIKRKNIDTKNHIAVLSMLSQGNLREKLDLRSALAKFIVTYLFNKSNTDEEESEEKSKDVGGVDFSVQELKIAYEESLGFFKKSINIPDIEDTLFYLSRIGAIHIEGGFLVVYNRLTIERKEDNIKKKYTQEDYKKLQLFYENKIQQIHIVGEYAQKMINDYTEALQFVDDYFQLNYSSFLNKYFKGSRQNELKQNITPSKFRQLFGELSPTQLSIIKDKDAQQIVVAAGPGSGKTRILVHKLASLLLMEDVKHEQLLMLTFSRAAATEFKKRLLNLIGNAANFIEIKTFHSYCFDLLGRIGNLEKSDEIIKITVEKIRNREVETSWITKTVLVIDEAQDMNEDEFLLIQTLMEQNEEMRVIAVGDDDQNIFEFRGADSKFMEQFIDVNKAVKYELVENYRSKRNLIDFSNQFVQRLSKRLKTNSVIAYQNDNGKISLNHYSGHYLFQPLAMVVLSSNLSGSTCILTRTNEEAMKIAGLLLRYGLRAKLIQSNEGFNLYNLDEIRFFVNMLQMDEQTHVISEEKWSNARMALISKYLNSPNLEMTLRLIKDFELTNSNRKYKMDFESFIRESKLDDFLTITSDVVFVSTIHKAKGREFDNIFIMISNFRPSKDEDIRLLYVAMTRAKNELTFYYNQEIFKSIITDNLTRSEVQSTNVPPEEIALQLSHSDVWLGYFSGRQKLLDVLMSGHELTVGNDNDLLFDNKSILKFSKQFQTKLSNFKTNNYILKSAKVNFIVYWRNDDSDQEIKIILPELYFECINF